MKTTGRKPKLSLDEVKRILEDTRKQYLIAREWGISRCYVSQIKSGVRLKGYNWELQKGASVAA